MLTQIEKLDKIDFFNKMTCHAFLVKRSVFYNFVSHPYYVKNHAKSVAQDKHIPILFAAFYLTQCSGIMLPAFWADLPCIKMIMVITILRRYHFIPIAVTFGNEPILQQHECLRNKMCLQQPSRTQETSRCDPQCVRYVGGGVCLEG